MNALIKRIVPVGVRRPVGRALWRVGRACHGVGDFFSQLYELMWLSRGKYAPGHPDAAFYDKYYPPRSPKEIKSVKENVSVGKASRVSPAISSLENPLKEGFIFMCDGRMFHGGPTDRLRGILTTYDWVKSLGKPFYISWIDPFPLEDYLMPASFDWRISPDEIVYDREKAFPFIIEDEPLIQSRMRMKTGLKQWTPQIHVYSNADNSRGHYRELFDELFKPSEPVKVEVDRHLSVLGNEFQAFTFRFLQLLGDFNDWNQDVLPPGEDVKFMERVGKEFLRLVDDVPQGKRILVTSDSRRFLDYMIDLDPRVYVVDGDVKNVDLVKGNHPEAWLKTFVDQQLLMNASKVTLMRTGGMFASGFPRFAAEVGGGTFIDHKF